MHKSFKWTVLSVFTVLTSACAVGSSPETSVNSDAKTPQTVRGSTQTDAEGSKPASKTFPEFSTKGKPTKTIDTPWGPREVYAIRKDVDAKRALNIAYNRDDITFGDITYGPLLPQLSAWEDQEVQYLRAAHMTSYHDLKRIGCQQVSRMPCDYYAQSFFRYPCGSKFLGKPALSQEELSAQVFSGDAVQREQYGYIMEENINKGRWHPSSMFAEVKYIDVSGERKRVFGTYFEPNNCASINNKNVESLYFIDERSGMSSDEIFDTITSITCSAWLPNQDFKSVKSLKEP